MATTKEHFAKVPRHLIEKLPAQMLRFLSRMLLFRSSVHPYVYVKQWEFAQSLGMSDRTVRRCLTFLMGHGYVRATGKFKEGRYKYYEVNLYPETEKEPIPEGPQEISQKTVEVLTGSFGAEKVAFQLAHLEELLKKDKNIRNPSGWLKAAVERNFTAQKAPEVERPKPFSLEAEMAKVDISAIEAYRVIEQQKSALFAKAKQHFKKSELQKLYEHQLNLGAKLFNKPPLVEAFSSFAKVEIRSQFQKAIINQQASKASKAVFK